MSGDCRRRQPHIFFLALDRSFELMVIGFELVEPTQDDVKKFRHGLSRDIQRRCWTRGYVRFPALQGILTAHVPAIANGPLTTNTCDGHLQPAGRRIRRGQK